MASPNYAARSLARQFLAAITELAGGTITPGGGQPTDPNATLAASQIATDSSRRFASDSQISRWDAGSRVRPVPIPLDNVSGTSFKFHGLQTTDIWVDVKNADGGPELNTIGRADKNNPDPDKRLNYVKVIVPEGEFFSGEMLVTKINAPVGQAGS